LKGREYQRRRDQRNDDGKAEDAPGERDHRLAQGSLVHDHVDPCIGRPWRRALDAKHAIAASRQGLEGVADDRQDRAI
jgi:hypothetical protein